MKSRIPLSVLDLAPIRENGSAQQSFADTVDLARHAEAWGFKRYWMAEHHSMPGIASAATAVLLGHVAGATSSIRVGAGGIMLPNHPPLVIAEQFGTLAALYPERIDLGLGRAPGSDGRTMAALRRSAATNPQAFPQEVAELMSYFSGEGAVQAIPGKGAQVPIWILGSSLFGAQLAAALGLPYAFASHFAPAQMIEAIALYRARFKPSSRLDKPWVMLGYNVFAADDESRAHYWASSWQQAFVQLRSGQPGRVPPPVEGYLDSLPWPLRKMLNQVLSCTAIGTPQQVGEQMREFAQRTDADELIITSNIYDHAARLRSHQIASEIEL